MKCIGRLIGSISVIVASLLGGEVWAQEASYREAGLALARRICSECHAVEKKLVPSPNSAAPRFETIANVPGMTAIALSVALQRSHQTMPNINLNANELRDIITYILSLQRAN
jgi:mono/diheme cytochrome c family protein